MTNNNRLFVRKVKLLIIGLSVLGMISCSIITKTSKAIDNVDKPELKVMTFNIRYGSADDGNNSWKYRKQILFEVIRDFNPDLMGMQEVLKFQLDELLEVMPAYSSIGVGREDGKTEGEYSPILFSKDRFIVDTTETFWFSDTPDVPGSKTWGNKYTRICTWAKLFDKFSGRNFYFLNVHLDHQSIPSRIKSAHALVAKINSFKEKLPVLLTGDFNTGEEEETISIIKESGLIDSYRILHVKSANEGTFNDFKGTDTGDKIDYIFISNDLKCKNAGIIKTSRKGIYPSDHFPVIAVLDFMK